ncbi:MAG: XdhC family protein [Acidobacteria bacterium]|nr:MAG: XdhC family protein [Acidobacteriota bacterium]RPJ80232.1 MAG: XdhC family protein [Acidobacteriota bacterium]
MNEEVFRALADALERGESAAVVTIVKSSGSTPQRVGAKMVVHADGRTAGTIGGGCYENDAIGKARLAMETGKPTIASYDLNEDLAAESGLVCGGRMEVFIDPVEATPRLYIIGAGHISLHLARFAAAAGFRVLVLDDRQKFANDERFPDAEIVVDEIPGWLKRESFPRSAFVAVVTRGHRHDMDALRSIGGRELRYVGMIGSRAKVARVREALADGSVPAEWLDRVHAPIGLAIGAITPAEIAISIVAEMIAVRRGAAPGGGRRGEAV